MDFKKNIAKKQDPQVEFSAETNEKLLAHELIAGATYQPVFADVFDKRWFTNKNYGVVSSLAMAFFKKYQKKAPHDVILAMLDKYAAKHPDVDKNAAVVALSDAENF